MRPLELRHVLNNPVFAKRQIWQELREEVFSFLYPSLFVVNRRMEDENLNKGC